MEWLSVIVGVLLILVGLVDLFFTVLHYDGFGFLSSRLYNSLFDVARFVTRPLPRTYRALGLSMEAPLMVPVTITVWIFLVSLGYALVYYAGMDGRTFSFSTSGLEPSFMEAMYFSGVTIATLGLGDVTPLSPLYQAIAVSEALVGFGILTLSITYVIGVYEVLRQLGVLAPEVWDKHHRTDWGLSATRSAVVKKIERRALAQVEDPPPTEEAELATFAEREKSLKWGRDAGLPPREYEVFRYFVEHPTA